MCSSRKAPQDFNLIVLTLNTFLWYKGLIQPTQWLIHCFTFFLFQAYVELTQNCILMVCLPLSVVAALQRPICYFNWKGNIKTVVQTNEPAVGDDSTHTLWNQWSSQDHGLWHVIDKRRAWDIDCLPDKGGRIWWYFLQLADSSWLCAFLVEKSASSMQINKSF
jgi:hypothetical protein